MCTRFFNGCCKQRGLALFTAYGPFFGSKEFPLVARSSAFIVGMRRHQKKEAAGQ